MKIISQFNLQRLFFLFLDKKHVVCVCVYVCIHVYLYVNVSVQCPEPFEMCLACASLPGSFEGSRAFEVLLKR